MNKNIKITNLNSINSLRQNFGEDKQLISDGYHTFKELYDIRLAYNVALFNEWCKDYNYQIESYKNVDVSKLHPEIKQFLKTITPKYNVHKSWRHYDGELCFGGGWFIVVAQLPSGQISNHYEAIHWDKFRIPETEKALFKFDEHTTQDVIKRLINL